MTTIPELVKFLREVKAEKEAFEAEIKPREEAARAQLVPLLEVEGNWEDEDGYARLQAPGQRVSYDHKAVDTLIFDVQAEIGKMLVEGSEDALKVLIDTIKQLQKLRKVSPVAGGLRVK